MRGAPSLNEVAALLPLLAMTKAVRLPSSTEWYSYQAVAASPLRRPTPNNGRAVSAAKRTMPKGQLVSRLPPNPGQAAGQRPHASWITALPPDLRPVVVKPAASAPTGGAPSEDPQVQVSLEATTTDSDPVILRFHVTSAGPSDEPLPPPQTSPRVQISEPPSSVTYRASSHQLGEKSPRMSRPAHLKGELTVNLFHPEMPQSMLYLTQLPASPVSETHSKPGSPRRTTAQPVLMATEVVASIHQLAELRVAEGATARPRARYGNERVRYSSIRVHPQHEPFRSPREPPRLPRSPRMHGQHPHAFPASSPRTSSPRNPSQTAPNGQQQPHAEAPQFLAVVRGTRETPTPWQQDGSLSEQLEPV